MCHVTINIDLDKEEKEMTVFEIVKKYVRGDKRGKREKATVELGSKDKMYTFLWDIAEKFDKKRAHFIIESYSIVK